MNSATTEPARRTHGRRVEGRGLIVFASVLLALHGLCAYGSRENLTA